MGLRRCALQAHRAREMHVESARGLKVRWPPFSMQQPDGIDQRRAQSSNTCSEIHFLVTLHLFHSRSQTTVVVRVAPTQSLQWGSDRVWKKHSPSTRALCRLMRTCGALKEDPQHTEPTFITEPTLGSERPSSSVQQVVVVVEVHGEYHWFLGPGVGNGTYSWSRWRGSSGDI